MQASLRLQLPADGPAALARRRESGCRASASVTLSNPISRSAAGPPSTSRPSAQAAAFSQRLRAGARTASRSRGPVACSASLAGASAAAAATAASPFVEVSFVAATVYALGVYGAMFLGERFRVVLESGYCLAPLAILYGVLLARARIP